jgi:hypothetical protein
MKNNFISEVPEVTVAKTNKQAGAAQLEHTPS